MLLKLTKKNKKNLISSLSKLFSDSHPIELRVQHVWSSVKAVTEHWCDPEH